MPEQEIVNSNTIETEKPEQRLEKQVTEILDKGKTAERDTIREVAQTAAEAINTEAMQTVPNEEKATLRQRVAMGLQQTQETFEKNIVKEDAKIKGVVEVLEKCTDQTKIAGLVTSAKTLFLIKYKNTFSRAGTDTRNQAPNSITSWEQIQEELVDRVIPMQLTEQGSVELAKIMLAEGGQVTTEGVYNKRIDDLGVALEIELNKYVGEKFAQENELQN